MSRLFANYGVQTSVSYLAAGALGTLRAGLASRPPLHAPPALPYYPSHALVHCIASMNDVWSKPKVKVQRSRYRLVRGWQRGSPGVCGNTLGAVTSRST